MAASLLVAMKKRALRTFRNPDLHAIDENPASHLQAPASRTIYDELEISRLISMASLRTRGQGIRSFQSTLSCCSLASNSLNAASTSFGVGVVGASGLVASQDITTATTESTVDLCFAGSKPAKSETNFKWPCPSGTMTSQSCCWSWDTSENLKPM